MPSFKRFFFFFLSKYYTFGWSSPLVSFFHLFSRGCNDRFLIQLVKLYTSINSCFILYEISKIRSWLGNNLTFGQFLIEFVLVLFIPTQECLVQFEVFASHYPVLIILKINSCSNWLDSLCKEVMGSKEVKS